MLVLYRNTGLGCVRLPSVCMPREKPSRSLWRGDVIVHKVTGRTRSSHPGAARYKCEQAKRFEEIIALEILVPRIRVMRGVSLPNFCC